MIGPQVGVFFPVVFLAGLASAAQAGLELVTENNEPLVTENDEIISL